MSSIVDGVGSLGEKIQNLPSLIGDALKGFFDDLKQAIVDLPETILDGLKDFFIPDSEYINESFNVFLDELKFKFNFDTDFFEGLFSNEAPVDDIETDYTIPNVGQFNLKLLDTSFLVDGVTYFRPFIRGFLVLLMLLYHIRQLIGFFGYDAGVVAGRSDSIALSKDVQRKE